MPIRDQSFRLLTGFAFAVALCAFAMPRANADDLDAIKQRGTLIAGVKADYPPFGFRSAGGEITGIEPTLAADVAKSLGVKLQLEPVAASNRVQLLRDGKIDLIIATMNATMERRTAVEIIKPYYYAAGFNVMAPKSMGLTSWAGLKGSAVCGVQAAYYNYEAATNFHLRVIDFANPADALAALKDGRCAALLYDDPWIGGALLDPRWRDYHAPLDPREEQPWGLAVRKDQPKWAAYLSAVVKKWEKDGTILDLETQYHAQHSRFAEEAHQKASNPSGH